MQDDGHVRVGGPHLAREVGPRPRHLLAPPRELHVGDDAKHVLGVAREGYLGLFPRRAEEDLGPRAHAQDLLREVQALGNDALRVVQQLGIHHGQERRVVTDVVLDQDDDLHPERTGVVKSVAPVFHGLDDAHQHPRVALPEKDALDGRGVLARLEVGELAGVPGEQDHRHVEPLGPDLLGERRRVHVGEVGGGDDQIDGGALASDTQRLFTGGDAGEPGSVVQVEVAKLPDHALGQRPRLLEDEGVVGGGNQEDVHDAVTHQVLVLVRATASGRAGHEEAASFVDNRHG